MIGLESLLAGSKESSSVFANEEMGAIRKAELLLAFKDELGAALSVGLGCSCHLRDALADGGAKNDDGGFAHKSLGKVDCGGDLGDVVAVLNPDNVEADRFESLGGIFALGCSGHGIKGHVIAVVNEDEIVEFQVASESQRLHGDTFLITERENTRTSDIR